LTIYEYSSATLVHKAGNMDKHALIDFFYFGGTDDKERTLEFILSQPDDWLESTHDYIQASSVELVGNFSWFPSWNSAGFDCHAQL